MEELILLIDELSDEVKSLKKDNLGNILAFANDYKMHGEKSYVFHNKEYLHSLYECFEVSMNDFSLNGEVLDYLVTKGMPLGKAFAKVYGIKEPETLEELTDIREILGNTEAFKRIIENIVGLNAVTKSFYFIKELSKASDDFLQSVAFNSRLFQNGVLCYKNIFDTIQANLDKVTLQVSNVLDDNEYNKERYSQSVYNNPNYHYDMQVKYTSNSYRKSNEGIFRLVGITSINNGDRFELENLERRVSNDMSYGVKSLRYFTPVVRESRKDRGASGVEMFAFGSCSILTPNTNIYPYYFVYKFKD